MIKISGKNNNILVISGRKIIFDENQSILDFVRFESLVVIKIDAYTSDIKWYEDYKIARNEFQKRINRHPTSLRAYDLNSNFIWSLDKSVISLAKEFYEGGEVLKVISSEPFHDILYLINPKTGKIFLETPTK